MNIEELKLIISAIGKLSGDATTALIWWMAFEIAKIALGCGTVASIAWMVLRTISGTHDWASLGRRVSVAYGGDGFRYTVSNCDRTAIDKAIARAKELK